MPGTREPHPEKDTALGVLTGLRDAQSRVDVGEIDKATSALAWAVMHSADTLVGPISSWEEHAMPIAGAGAPEVAEFCVAELAASLGVSTDSGRLYLGDIVELRYRLPKTWARVLSGQLKVWKARRIAQATLGLPLDAAGFVDTHVSSVAHTIGIAALDRPIGEAQTRYDPAAAEAARFAAGERRCFDVHSSQGGYDGTVEVTGTLDLADALDLDTALTHGAADLATLGSAESLDVRRSRAAGVLARNQPTLDLTSEPAGARPPGQGTKARQLVLHVHLADAAIARLEETSSTGAVISVAKVQAWCTNPDTQVVIQPVIDLNAAPHTGAYEIPDPMRQQVILRDSTCVFPWCTRNARRCDIDHVVPFDQGGRTTPSNLAPLCRRHHRHKTTGAWTYTPAEPPDGPPGQSTGDYTWTSPHGHRYATGRHGTHTLDPTDTADPAET